MLCLGLFEFGVGWLLLFALRQFGCLGHLLVLLIFIEVLIFEVLGENIRLCMSVCCLFAEVDWFLPVAKGMIQRLEELCRFDSYFSLLELFIILILILTRLVTSTHRLRQIIFKLSLIFASLFAISLLPLADTLTQLCSKLYLLLHPLQLLQKLIHC